MRTRIDYKEAITSYEKAKQKGITLEEEIKEEYSYIHNEIELKELINEYKKMIESFKREYNEIKTYLDKNDIDEIDDEEFAISMIKKSADPVVVLANVTKRLVDNKKVAMATVEMNGDLIDLFPFPIKKDSDVQIAALKNGGHINLKSCNEIVRDDYDAALASLSWYESDYEYLSERLKNDRSFNIKLVENNAKAYKYISASFKTDEEIALLALSKAGASWFLKVAGDAINNKNIMLNVIKKSIYHHDVPKYLSDELKNDRDIILALCEDEYGFDYRYIQYASSELKNNPDFIFEVFKKYKRGKTIDKVRLEDFFRLLSTDGVNDKTIKEVMERIKNNYGSESNDISNKTDPIANADYNNYESIEDIIYTTNKDADEYQIGVTKLLVESIGIDKWNPKGRKIRESLGFDIPDYNKVVKSIYLLAEELLKSDETTRLLLYEYGHRDSEYEAFRNKLSEMTGIDVNRFTSDVEKQIEDIKQYGVHANTDRIKSLMISKPVVYIGKEKSYYQEDMADPDSYKKEVKKNPDISFK